MYNRHPRKAISLAIDERDDHADNDYEAEQSEEEDTEDVHINEMVERLLAIRERCHLKAKTNISNAQQKQKHQYDKKHNALKVNFSSA